MRKWDKVQHKFTGVEGMITDIDDIFITVRCDEEEKKLTHAQFERYWDTTYAIQKPGPKPQPKKGGAKKVHRSKYAVGTIARYYNIYTPNKTRYYLRKELCVNEILEYVKDIAINQYGMKFEEVNERDFKFRTPYTAGKNKDGFSVQCTLMVRLYTRQVNIYTKSMWLTPELKKNPRMIFQKYYYDKMMRVPNFNDATKEFIAKLIESVNVNYKEVERPQTYDRRHGKKKSTKQRQKRQEEKEKEI